jgi:hypothetical protein
MCAILLQQQLQTSIPEPLTKTERIIYRRMLHVNKTTLSSSTLNDFECSFEVDGVIHKPIQAKKLKKHVYNLRKIFDCWRAIIGAL